MNYNFQTSRKIRQLCFGKRLRVLLILRNGHDEDVSFALAEDLSLAVTESPHFSLIVITGQDEKHLQKYVIMNHESFY